MTRVEAGALGVLQLRVPGGAVIERAPPGSEIGVEINLDEAVALPD